VRPEGLGKFKNSSPHRESNPRPSGLEHSALSTTLPRASLVICIQGNNRRPFTSSLWVIWIWMRVVSSNFPVRTQMAVLRPKTENKDARVICVKEIRCFYADRRERSKSMKGINGKESGGKGWTKEIISVELQRTSPLAQTHFRKTETTRNHPHQSVLITPTKVKTLHKQQTSHIQNNTQSNLDLRNTTLGYGFHFQHRLSRTFPNERFEHDSGHTSVCTEYGYPKGSPNTKS
jgi:hypothetical protein